MSTARERPPGGFALPVTIFALVVIGALVSGGILLSTQEARISDSYDLGARAFSVADYGVEEVLGTWRNQDLMTASPDAAPRMGAWAGSRYLGDYEVRVRSLGSRVYMIRVTGTATAGPRSSTRSIAALTRTTSAELPYESALSLLGALSVEGRAGISGTDLCRPDSAVPGVTTTDMGNVSTTGRGEVGGNPDVKDRPGMTVDSLSQFGDVDLDDLIAWATKVYAPGANPTNMQPTTTTDGDGDTICDTSDTSNWGDTISSNPCGSYYPVVYGQGDLTLNGAGRGAMAQGILIVEGDLTIDGNVEFKGLVIAKGDLYYAGTGGHVEGAMIIMGGGASLSAGNSALDYNSCTVADALNGGIRPRTLSSRHWVDLSGTVRPLQEN